MTITRKSDGSWDFSQLDPNNADELSKALTLMAVQSVGSSAAAQQISQELQAAGPRLQEMYYQYLIDRLNTQEIPKTESDMLVAQQQLKQSQRVSDATLSGWLQPQGYGMTPLAPHLQRTTDLPGAPGGSTPPPSGTDPAAPVDDPSGDTSTGDVKSGDVAVQPGGAGGQTGPDGGQVATDHPADLVPWDQDPSWLASRSSPGYFIRAGGDPAQASSWKFDPTSWEGMGLGKVNVTPSPDAGIDNVDQDRLAQPTYSQRAAETAMQGGEPVRTDLHPGQSGGMATPPITGTISAYNPAFPQGNPADRPGQQFPDIAGALRPALGHQGSVLPGASMPGPQSPPPPPRDTLAPYNPSFPQGNPADRPGGLDFGSILAPPTASAAELGPTPMPTPPEVPPDTAWPTPAPNPEGPPAEQPQIPPPEPQQDDEPWWTKIQRMFGGQS